jgi:hypothetical protein
LRANRFLLGMCSPVLNRMMCGSFKESNETKLKLKDVDGAVFRKVLDIWCGKENNGAMELKDVKELASVADRFQMVQVTLVLEETLVEHLDIGMSGDVISWGSNLGLLELEAAARKLATERFEQLATTDGFMRINEDVLGRLLDDDTLTARNEEVVWEAVVRWRTLRAEGGQARGGGLVGKIRFPLMEEGYLRSRVVGMAPKEEAILMKGFVAEALLAKAAQVAGKSFEFKLLGPKALNNRVVLGVRWGDYEAGGERRLRGHKGAAVMAFAECEGRVCSGFSDGSIQVWSMTGGSDEPERMLIPDRAIDLDSVFSLSACSGRLIGGYRCGKLRVWNVMTGACDQVLQGHRCEVHALAMCGSLLASGSYDKSVRLWAMGAAGLWACERTLLGHTRHVFTLAGWQGKVLSGSGDYSIRVWDAGTGAHDATLTGHGGAVNALVVHGHRLFSASYDGTIRAWALGTWAALRTVEAGGQRQGLYCLAVSGSQLISGIRCSQGMVLVWGLETLDLQHALPQPEGEHVWAIMAVREGVWAGVGNNVVVWKREM